MTRTVIQRNSPASNIQVDTIFATAYHDIGERQRARGWNGYVNFIRSDNYFQTRTILVECGNMFAIIDKRVSLRIGLGEGMKGVAQGFLAIASLLLIPFCC